MNLSELLSDPHISVPELFQQPDILNQIKYKLATFVEFCKHNEDFTNIMITLGIKTPMHRHENIQMRKISHIASDILTSDNDNIADLFVLDQTQPRIRCYSEDDDEILEEIVSNQATGELTITDRAPSKEQKETNQFNKKYKYLLDLLSYLNQATPDENCVNYMIKVFNTVVRVKPDQVFYFFREKPQIMKKMIEFTNFPSVSYSIAKIINEGQDKKYREFKIEVVHMVIKQILGKLDSNNFHVYAEFVQEVFDKNRHRGEEQDELKIATQCLVDKELINTILASVLSTVSPPQRVSNCLLYLLKVCERMNIDEEQDPYSYNQPSSNKPTMDFQVDDLFNNYHNLLQLAPSINRQKYTSTQILAYYELLLAIAKNSRFKAIEIDRISNILTLLKVLNVNENGFNGIIKNKIVFLIQVIYHHSNNNTVTNSTTTSQATNTQKYEQIHNQIQKLTEGKTQALCYKEKLHLLFGTSIDRMIINQVHTKYSSVLAPTNYTENRNYKVKELQFVKLHINRYNNNSKQGSIDEVNEKVTQNGSEEKLEEHVMIEDDKKAQSNSNGIGFNLNFLNSKIHAIKTKRYKQQQEEEQANKAKELQSEQVKPKQQDKPSQKQQIKQQVVVSQQTEQQSKIQELPQQSTTSNQSTVQHPQSKPEEKQKQKQLKQKQKQKEPMKQKQAQKQNQSKGDPIKFYVKYLMLF